MTRESTTEDADRQSGLLRKLLSTGPAILGFIIVSAFLFTALFAPYLTPYSPAEQRPELRLSEPGFVDNEGNRYWLGTDNLGRDLLSRIISGTRVSAIVGITSVVFSGIIGTTIGLTAGFFGGRVDAVLMRLIDTLMAFPALLLALAIAGVLGTGLFIIVVILSITRWVIYARVVRSEVLSLRNREFVEAARAMGQRDSLIIFRHLLPNVIPSLIVLGTLNVGEAIMAESALSFLGVGVQPPVISWGQLLAIGRTYVATSWWLATFPGLAITVVILSIMLMGDRLRDILDPRLRT